MSPSLEDNPRDPNEIHQSALVIDTHADTPQRFLDESWDFTSPLNGGMINLDSARAGNLTAEFFAIWVDPDQYSPPQHVPRTVALLEAVHDQLRRHPDQLQLCLTPQDILTAYAQKKFAALIGIEGGHSIANSLDQLRAYHRLGARYMTLTWANSNDWADSSGDIDDPAIPHHNGLTAFGKQVIAEMNSLGMMVDVSHVSDKTFWDVLAVTRAPIIASHSSARTLTAAPRNLTDDQLRAIAANKGVAMINFFPAFIDEGWRSAWIAQRPERTQAHAIAAAPYQAVNQPVPFTASNQIDRHFAAKIGRAPFNSLIDHFDHVIQIAGIDHIGIGTDFDGIPVPPEGIDSAADLPKITAALIARGHSRADLHKLLGGNLLRVFNAVQTAADPIP
jgi:membrane dipeptidase